MTRLDLRHSLRLRNSLRMERVVAYLRCAVVAISAGMVWVSPRAVESERLSSTVWVVAASYAVGVLITAPYRRVPILAWEVASNCVDWGLISIGIVATGGVHSDLYILYFLFVLAIGLRFGLREVVGGALATAAGYLTIVILTGSDWAADVASASLRMGHLLVGAIGVGFLARQAIQHARARVEDEAQRLAVEEVAATVSHDLKNPLAAVGGLIEILLDPQTGALSPQQRALLVGVGANVQQMGSRVANLVDAQLIERGLQPLRPSLTDLNGLVRRVVKAQANQAEAKNIGLVIDLAPELPLALLDPNLLERLVANLLSNAVKFTPKHGAIRVSTAQADGRLSLEVWNSGSEIPANLQAALFEKFVRRSDSTGIGLGLYICRSIVGRHKGTIGIQNPSGGGVAFMVRLPLNPAPQVEALTVASTPPPVPRNRAWPFRRRAAALAG